MHILKRHNSSGFSLVGILVMIVAMAIMTSVALEVITPVIEENRRLETEASLMHIGHAILGDYAKGGSLSGADFGYVGDVGSMPASLSSLISNPGVYATWNGPYLRDAFLEATNQSLSDSWGTTFNYTGGSSISSTGSGGAISRSIAKATGDLLNCGFSGTAEGANRVNPGSSALNLIALVTYPNGIGGTSIDTTSVLANGVFTFASGLPLGIRNVTLKDTITGDVVTSFVRLLPRSTSANTNIGVMRLPTTNY